MNPKHILGRPCNKNPEHIVEGSTLRNKLGNWCVACDKEYRTVNRDKLSAQQAARRAKRKELFILKHCNHEQRQSPTNPYAP